VAATASSGGHNAVGSQRQTPSWKLKALGVFLLFGAAMASLAGITLLWPGTPLDLAWELNASAHRELSQFGARYGIPIGIPFLALSAAFLAAGVGWLGRRAWGWRLAVTLIAIQALGDAVNLVRGELLAGAVGVSVAGALLFWMLQPQVRAVFVPPR
jgi:hypothetical protein